MSRISSFIQNPKDATYDGKDNDEEILVIIRQSQWTNVKWVLGVAAMVVLPIVVAPFFYSYFGYLLKYFNPFFIFMLWVSWYLLTFGLWMFNFFNWFFNVYIITNKKIIDYDFYGLTYKNISDTLIANVEDVTSKIVGPFNTIANIGNVYVQTAAEREEFEFLSVDDPGKLRDMISDLAAKTKRHA
jgi:hypothetical protein